MHIQGILTKTISIELTENVFSYPLNTNNRFLGMPKNAKILAIWNRRPAVYLTDKDVKGKAISNIAQNYGTINLKDKGGDNILQNIPLSQICDLIENAGFSFTPVNLPQTFFAPISNDCVDWLSSTINISTSVSAPTTIVSGEVVELTIYYTLDCNFDFKKYYQEYDSNVRVLGVRSSLLSITIETGTPAVFDLSTNSSIGIPNEATIIGFKPIISTNIHDTKNLVNANQATQAASFLTLQHGQKIILDAMPLKHIFPTILGIPYFPLPPMPVSEMDWESSKIQCSDPSVLAAGQAYLIMIYYVCKEQSTPK